MTKPVAILIEDEPDIRELLSISLNRAGLECLQAASFAEGKSLIQATKCDFCLTDVRMPDGSGLDLVKYFKSVHPNVPIAVMTAFDTTEIAVQAMKYGAFDFLSKPIRAKRLEALINDALNVVVTDESPAADNFIGVAGNSSFAQNLRKIATKAAKSMAPVVIQGDVGSGKERLARHIHDKSLRSLGPFVSIDCSAITAKDTTINAEHSLELGEHNSDISTHNPIDVFQRALGGSLFLDEIGSLPDHLQSSLLIALRERKTPSSESEHLDTRIFVGSIKPLESLVESGKLRHDLYYMLSVIDIVLEPLRNRSEDLPEIFEQILVVSQEQATTISESAMQALLDYDFPGNLSELENILLRAQTTCEDNEIRLEDLQFPPNFIGSATVSVNSGVDPLKIDDLEHHLAETEKEIISAVLADEKWSQKKAAKRLNLTPRQFRYKLAKHRLNEDD